MRSAHAQITQDAFAITGGGDWMSNGTHNLVYAMAQPGTTGVSTNERMTLYAGFIGGALLRPGETNAQGVPFEADPDNDDDQLADWDEVSGNAFDGNAHTDPNNADTDGDGMSDYEEAVGMFDPNDPNHCLWIRSLESRNDYQDYCIKWIGRGGGAINTILWSRDLLSNPLTNQLVVTNLSGGVAPWYKVTNTYTWSNAGDTLRIIGITSER